MRPPAPGRSTTGTRRWVAAAIAVALTGATIAVGVAGADTVPAPTQWPASPELAPTMGANAHAVRISGADRHQTNLAAALLLRGDAGYPFSTPLRTNGWWGAGTCPGAIVVVAGDSTADALAAAPLSDPTDQSSEPQLQISATADPTFYGPVGATRRVDTDRAPVILTRSTREGAAGLSSAAQTSAFDLAQGACTANEAIVVGGGSSVPTAVDQQLIALGYDRVFRAAGPDRFATAAAITRALGTGPAMSASCPDPDTTDGTARAQFLGNATVELRSGPTSCSVLARTVVLADGVVGADALAAGWWTSLWQVPVLLSGPDGTLPQATRDALSLMSLQIDNVVVLGGTGRIPDSTMTAASALASASARRVAGTDRYDTSVQMAKAFGGWHPTGDGADFAGSMVCLAASGGSGTGTSPDALGAGPWCAAVGGAAGGPGAPSRALPPVAGPAMAVVPAGLRPAHDQVPVLLVQPGTDQLPPSVASLLGGAFDPDTTWCSGAEAEPGCSWPGFAIGFGGSAALTPGALTAAAEQVSGGRYGTPADLAPSLGPVHWTQLDLSPVYHRLEGAAAGVDQVCAPRGALDEVRWLAAWTDAARTTLRAAADAVLIPIYRLDADGAARTLGVSSPTCLGLGEAGGEVHVDGVSLSGHPTAAQVLDLDHTLRLSSSVSAGPPTASTGSPSGATADDSVTELTFTTQSPGGSVVVDGQSTPITATTLRLRLVRSGTAGAADGVTGTATIITGTGTFTLDLAGEGLYDGQVWRLRGASVVRSAPGVSAGTGGFRVDLNTGPGTGPADDSATWAVDALIQPA